MTYVFEVLNPITALHAEPGQFLVVESSAAGPATLSLVNDLSAELLHSALFAASDGALRMVDPPVSAASAADVLRGLVMGREV